MKTFKNIDEFTDLIIEYPSACIRTVTLYAPDISFDAIVKMLETCNRAMLWTVVGNDVWQGPNGIILVLRKCRDYKMYITSDDSIIEIRGVRREEKVKCLLLLKEPSWYEKMEKEMIEKWQKEWKEFSIREEKAYFEHINKVLESNKKEDPLKVMPDAWTKQAHDYILRQLEGWQTCPHCEGDGKVLRWAPSTTPAFDPCPVCLAERIISKVNGLPPSRQPK